MKSRIFLLIKLSFVVIFFILLIKYLNKNFTADLFFIIKNNIEKFLISCIIFTMFLLASSYRLFLYFRLDSSNFIQFLNIHLQGFLLNIVFFQTGNVYRAVIYRKSFNVEYYNFLKYFILNSFINTSITISFIFFYKEYYLVALVFILALYYKVRIYGFYNFCINITTVSLLLISAYSLYFTCQINDNIMLLSLFNTIVNALPLSSLLGFSEFSYFLSSFVFSTDIKILVGYSLTFKIVLIISTILILLLIFIDKILKRKKLLPNIP